MPSADLILRLRPTEAVTLKTVLDLVEMLVVYTSEGVFPGDAQSAADVFGSFSPTNPEMRRTFVDILTKVEDLNHLAMKGIAA